MALRPGLTTGLPFRGDSTKDEEKSIDSLAEKLIRTITKLGQKQPASRPGSSNLLHFAA